ncbi:glycosyltransferase family 2 protein [Marinomonas mediterranea]|jgi:Glycosyltransferases involved in cell wall biogenesis|uniref:Glycosyl transferase family 2 n=1 Tax=Marinomonas mediterranea (strain ATCC 700492 / JCM 21426 / NBRC 103028 / MMB-1) TaxID=717774 RepID=F2K4N5_MARM1|nr:glycosyltransferase family 2 protein [Marinomonas mediterranea]ADZ91428.1 glycosyl transferase family 2 [Marinomonas mediterranea MMB-1]WCN17538.1 glycosyltransferase [Marinomonas mediterranea MMB-1]
MQNSLVSVITPVYKGQKTLVRAVQSLLGQSHENWECIIASDDGFDYLSWLKQQGIKDERLKFVFTGKAKSGPNIARNTAKKIANGDWIAPLDADDLYYPQRLATLLKAADQTGVALDNVNVVNDQNEQHIDTAFDVSYIKERADINDTTLGGKITLPDFFQTDTPLLMLFHKSIATHNWENVSRGGDTLFNMRAVEKAGWAAFHNEALHEYRVHDESMCHGTNVGSVFQEAYEYTLLRLEEDGFGFESEHAHHQVIQLIKQKIQLNKMYEKARLHTPELDFQTFRKSVINA